MKPLPRICVTAMLLLWAGLAQAGVIFVPVGGRYLAPELAAVDIRAGGENGALLEAWTTTLTGELSLDAADVPPGYGAPAQGCAVMPVEHDLGLVINLSLGVVEGSARGRILVAPGEAVDFEARVQGDATCVARDGQACGQIVMDLELRGALSDPNDPARVGLLRMEALGSLVQDGVSGHWAALSANARLGLNESLVPSLLETMDEGETCGV